MRSLIIQTLKIIFLKLSIINLFSKNFLKFVMEILKFLFLLLYIIFLPNHILMYLFLFSHSICILYKSRQLCAYVI